MSERAQGASAFRGDLPDGSKIERSFTVTVGPTGKKRRVGRGNWQWAVYDPDRRPTRKRVNLYTKDKGAAMGKALGYARRFAVGAFDPWTSVETGNGTAFTEAVGAYLAAKSQTASPTTVSGDSGHLKRLARLLPAGTDVRHVETDHVEAFVNARKKAPRGSDGRRRGLGPEASPETKKRRRATVQHFFGWAVEAGLCPANPADAVRLPKMTPARRDHVTDDEAAAMLRAITAAEVVASARIGEQTRRGGDTATTYTGMDRGWIRDWFVFGLGTGLRPGEQQQLRWSAVRLAERAVEVGKGHRVKTTGSRRTVPVAGAALDVLSRLAEARTTEADGPVFTGAGGDAVAVDYLSKCLQSFAAEASVDKNVTAYSLRHAYGTRMAAAGVPLLDLARLMGTGVRMIEKHYGHYDPARGASHVERVFGATYASAVESSGAST